MSDSDHNDTERQILQRLTKLETQQKTIIEQQRNLVTKDAFRPVAGISYGLAGFVLLAVLGALVTGVVHAFG